VKKKNTSGEKKKHIGQGGCSSTKRAERAHPQLVHWWVLIHSSRWVRIQHLWFWFQLVTTGCHKHAGLAIKEEDVVHLPTVSTL